MESSQFLVSSRIMVPVLFTILLAGIIGTQDAFAFTTKTYIGEHNGDWEISENWSPSGVPEKNDHVVITNTLVNIKSDVTIGPSGNIAFNNDGNLRVNNPGSTLTIQGTVVMNGIKDDLFSREGTIVNDVMGSILLDQGQVHVQGTRTGGIFINHGTITGTLTGTPPPGEAPSTNDFNIVIHSGGFFSNSGTCPLPLKVLTGGTIEVSCFYENTNFNLNQVTEDTIDQIDSVSQQYSGTPVEDKLLAAMDKLDTALVELAKPTPDNEAAIGNMEGVVGEIEAAISESMDLAEATQIMDDIAEIVRQMAVSAINLALNEPNADSVMLSDAQNYLAEGDMLRDSGAFKDAVNEYKEALSEANGALE